VLAATRGMTAPESLGGMLHDDTSNEQNEHDRRWHGRYPPG